MQTTRMIQELQKENLQLKNLLARCTCPCSNERRADLVAQTLSPFAALCKVKIQKVKRVARRFLSPFGDCLGIDWKNRSILYSSNLEIPGALIHELGHLVFDSEKKLKALRFSLTDTDEYRFFGWEWLVAKKTGLTQEWKSYLFNGYFLEEEIEPFGILEGEFRDFSGAERLAILKFRVQEARRLGYAKGNTPVTQNPSPSE